MMSLSRIPHLHSRLYLFPLFLLSPFHLTYPLCCPVYCSLVCFLFAFTHPLFFLLLSRTTRAQTHISAMHTNPSAQADKPFACSHPGCSKRFAQEAQLTIHMKIHEGANSDTSATVSDSNAEASETTTAETGEANTMEAEGGERKEEEKKAEKPKRRERAKKEKGEKQTKPPRERKPKAEKGAGGERKPRRSKAAAQQVEAAQVSEVPIESDAMQVDGMASESTHSSNAGIADSIVVNNTSSSSTKAKSRTPKQRQTIGGLVVQGTLPASVSLSSSPAVPSASSSKRSSLSGQSQQPANKQLAAIPLHKMALGLINPHSSPSSTSSFDSSHFASNPVSQFPNDIGSHTQLPPPPALPSSAFASTSTSFSFTPRPPSAAVAQHVPGHNAISFQFPGRLQ